MGIALRALSIPDGGSVFLDELAVVPGGGRMADSTRYARGAPPIHPTSDCDASDISQDALPPPENRLTLTVTAGEMRAR